jgi:hypothetical protein
MSFATKCAEAADARCLYICMRVCVSMFDVVKPCVSMCAPLRRSMPAGCGAPFMYKDLPQSRIPSTPSLLLIHDLPAASITINYSFVTFNDSFFDTDS